jgi:nitrite reductase/ring-hydroxylating ferredoxin subunit
MSTQPNENERIYADGRPLGERPQWDRDFPTDVPADQTLARREFTKFLVLTSGAMVAGQCWIAGMSAFQGEASYPEVKIADDDAVPPDGIVEFRYPTDHDPCLLIRLRDGRLVAYNQKCSHLACAVIPQPQKDRLLCPCHNGYFEIAEGRPTAGPPRRPLPRIKLKVEDGAIYAMGVEFRTV